MSNVAVVAIVGIIALAVVALGVVAMLCKGLFRAWGMGNRCGEMAVSVEVGQNAASEQTQELTANRRTPSDRIGDGQKA